VTGQETAKTATLLYESEATLRMVERVLEELRIAGVPAIPEVPGLVALLNHSPGPPQGTEITSEFRNRAFREIDQLLRHLREGRESLRRAESGEPPGRVDEAIRFVDEAEGGLTRLAKLFGG